MRREDYIADFAVLIALGGDDETKTDAEYFEATAMLDRAEIQIPVPMSNEPLVMGATA